LVDISNATGLRVDDIAFTLNEVGFLRHRKALNGGNGGNGGNGESAGNAGNAGSDGSGGEDAGVVVESVVVVSREMVEQVAKERNVKRMCMEVQHVLL
jgi:histone acetyltransferase HTATIP/histone acetyltransferase MYST1